jgi:hypothetical protein
MDGRESLGAKPIGGKGSRETPEVAIDDGLIDDPAGASRVPGGDDRGREGKDDCDGRHPRGGRPCQ